MTENEAAEPLRVGLQETVTDNAKNVTDAPETVTDNAKNVMDDHKTVPEHEKPMHKRRKDIDAGKIMALKNAGWTNKEIAAEMRMEPQQVASALYRYKKKMAVLN